MCLNAWLLFFGRTCKDTCQGIDPGLTFRPPKILVMDFFGCAFPQVENGCGAAVVLAGVSVGAEVGCEASVGFSGIAGLVVDGVGTSVGLAGAGWVMTRVVVGSGEAISVGDSSKKAQMNED